MKLFSNPVPGEEPSPAERWVPLAAKLALYLWLGVIFAQAASAFAEYHPGRPWPAMLSILRTFTFLPLHEAGHVIFYFFGRTLMFLGGSFWQIMFPLLWFVIALRQKSRVAPFPLFWVGENMMDVSLYMRDAPLRQLPLLGGHKVGHDWYNLFSAWNMLGDAATVADIFYYTGAVVCLAALGAGTVLAFRTFFSPEAGKPDPLPVSPSDLEDSLDELLERNKKESLE